VLKIKNNQYSGEQKLLERMDLEIENVSDFGHKHVNIKRTRGDSSPDIYLSDYRSCKFLKGNPSTGQAEHVLEKD
jgi:hypothetical protein